MLMVDDGVDREDARPEGSDMSEGGGGDLEKEEEEVEKEFVKPLPLKDQEGDAYYGRYVKLELEVGGDVWVLVTGNWSRR